MRIINCKITKNIKNLQSILNVRRDGRNINTSIVPRILKNIKSTKNIAVRRYERKFGNNNKIKPSVIEIKKSIKKLDPEIKKAIDFAYARIFKFHKLQKTKNIKYLDKYSNIIEHKYVPINSLGIYIPANLPSSLLMNAIPAKIAQVKRIVLANPRTNGQLNPAVMYVAKKCGIKEIINVSGAQAIGSLAYVQKVDKIVGPGSDYVARAKKEVFGTVGIEGMIAGPSEVTVIADKSTNVDQVATSMIAQSEHGENSQSILVTKDLNIIKKTKKKIDEYLKYSERKNIIKKSLKRNGIFILAKSDNQICDIVNIIAPEHLEIILKKYNKYLDKIYNAGSIGVGEYSPVAASDYNVGTNHTLGTLGSSKFASGLNLNDFYKKISIFKLSKKGIEVIGKKAITLADYEKLPSHSLSIKSRMKNN